MPTTVQFRRGTTAQNLSFTGAVGEISIDTDLKVIRVHDGALAGGTALISATSTQTLSGKTFSGNTSFAGNIFPTGNANANIGSTTLQFNTIHAKATSAQYADLAENYIADADYAPGTVVIFGGEQEITTTTESHDTRVAGVISTSPAYLMNSVCDGLPVALQGRVPCQVKGPVCKGDLLVTSNIPGVAQKLNQYSYAPGCVVGKSLENFESDEQTLIEIVVGRL